MTTAKVGRRGQVILPRAIRMALGLRQGDQILLIPKGDQVILRPLPHTLLDLRGSVPVSEEQDFAAIRQQVLATRVHKASTNED